MEGKCLETLVVGTSRVLDFTYTPCVLKFMPPTAMPSLLPRCCCRHLPTLSISLWTRALVTKLSPTGDFACNGSAEPSRTGACAL